MNCPMGARYRLQPTASEAAVMARHCADARYVWNLALEQINLYRPHWGPTPNHLLRNRQLTEARAGSWLGEGSCAVQQTALRDFDQALRHWWSGINGRPTWRKAGVNESFYVRRAKVVRLNRKWATVHVPKLGPVRFRLSRPVPKEATTARIIMDRSGRWHVAFIAPQPDVERRATGDEIGIDVGVVHAVSLSNGDHMDMPALLTPGEAQRKIRLQRQLARQRKGSNRRERTRRAIAKVSAREVDRRTDWIEKSTTDLVRRFDLIAIEDLKVANMVRSASGTLEHPGENVRQKAGLNRAIRNQAWAKFRIRLQQKAVAATTECVVVAVNPRHTSQRCACCGHIDPNNRESQAVFVCRACGIKRNADVNAAINILAAGQAVTGRRGRLAPDEASTTRTVQGLEPHP